MMRTTEAGPRASEATTTSRHTSAFTSPRTHGAVTMGLPAPDELLCVDDRMPASRPGRQRTALGVDHEVRNGPRANARGPWSRIRQSPDRSVGGQSTTRAGLASLSFHSRSKAVTK